MKVLVLGSSGMLGHMLYYYLKENNYEVYGTARSDNYDFNYDAFLEFEKLEDIIKKIKPDFIVNCIGILNKEAENNHYLATKLNSLLPHYIDNLSYKYNFKFIHISTDCVFSGSRGGYIENDLPDANSFYGRSKFLGEILCGKNVTLRTSIVGPDINEKGIGLFHWFMNQRGEINGYTNAIWSGVTTLQLSKIICSIIDGNLNIQGIHHVVNNLSISKYNLLNLFKKYTGKDIKIKKYDLFCENKSLVNSNDEFLNIIPSYDEMVEEMIIWINNHEKIYTYKERKKI